MSLKTDYETTVIDILGASASQEEQLHDKSFSAGIQAEPLPTAGIGKDKAGRDCLALDKDKAAQGLAKLVLTVIELIRKLMEKQALARVASGSLTEEQMEELGITLMKLEEKMGELKKAFGLEDEDLNLNLGPLGNLM